MDAATLTITLDVLLVIFALLALYFRPRIGGQLAIGLRLLMIGVFILGLTHLADTLIHDFITTISTTDRSLLHRLLNLIGFVFIFVGFFRMKRAIEA
jgi:hypothetical protein